MDTFIFYLFKSAVWLTGFAIVYFLFLRGERYFRLKRFYLIAGILASFCLPVVTLHYSIELPRARIFSDNLSPARGILIDTPSKDVEAPISSYVLQYSFLFVYLAGIVFLLYRLFRRLRLLNKTISGSYVIRQNNLRLVRTYEFDDSFSFFSYVFINPSVKGQELKIILDHEMVHVSQKHWIDLCLVEFLRIFQWINPLAWFYPGFIRQNHEYIADEAVLKCMPDQSLYRAVLINQLFSSEVICLTNSFNYSLDKKRFDMMKKVVSQPYRKVKLLLVLPVFAIVFYAFAEPEYHFASQPAGSLNSENNGSRQGKGSELLNNDATKNMLPQSQGKEVSGVVVQQDGKPLNGAVILINGTTVGTVSDPMGLFRLGSVTDESMLTVSFVGFKTITTRPLFNSKMTVRMQRDTLNYNEVRIISRDDMVKDPLIVIDGAVTDFHINKIPLNDADMISVNVLKNEEAKARYGAKGQNGVLEITTKNGRSVNDPAKSHNRGALNGESKAKEEKPFVVVEELPEFPGGKANLDLWLLKNIRYPGAAKLKRISGKVYVSFTILVSGKVTDIRVSKPVDPLLDAEALRVVGKMPAWKPGTQAGKPVEVKLNMPVEFILPEK